VGRALSRGHEAAARLGRSEADTPVPVVAPGSGPHATGGAATTTVANARAGAATSAAGAEAGAVVAKRPALEGDLAQMAFATILRLLDVDRQTGVLRVEADDRRWRLVLRKGRIIRAETTPGAAIGAPAIYEALELDAGLFVFHATEVEGADEIQSTTSYLVMEAARRADEMNMAKADDANMAKADL